MIVSPFKACMVLTKTCDFSPKLTRYFGTHFLQEFLTFAFLFLSICFVCLCCFFSCRLFFFLANKNMVISSTQVPANLGHPNFFSSPGCGLMCFSFVPVGSTGLVLVWKQQLSIPSHHTHPLLLTSNLHIETENHW